MFKQLVVGTAVLAAALAIVPTAAQAQQPYYGNYGNAYNNNYAYGDNYAYGNNNYSYGDGYGRDRYVDRESRRRHERWEQERQWRERERRESARRYYDNRYRYGYEGRR